MHIHSQIFAVAFCLLHLFRNGAVLMKVPSASNIEEYDDPLLDEIFADTNSDNPAPSRLQQQSGAGLTAPQTTLPKSEVTSLLASQQQRQDVDDQLVAMAAPKSPALLAAATKNAIDPNVKPPAGSIFSNPAMSHLPDLFGGGRLNQASPTASDFPSAAGVDAAGNSNNMFAAGPLTDFAFQTGQAFYTGVRQASRLLGIDAGQYQQYEVPLISQGARLFGRRR